MGILIKQVTSLLKFGSYIIITIIYEPNNFNPVTDHFTDVNKQNGQ